MSSVFYAILFLAILIYGIVHIQYYKSSHLKKGYVETKAIILKQFGYHPPKPGSSSKHYKSIMKFTMDEKEFEVEVYVNGGPPDDEDIGKEKVILVNKNNPTDAIYTDFENQKNGGIIMIVEGFLGMIGFGIAAFRHITK